MYLSQGVLVGVPAVLFIEVSSFQGVLMDHFNIDSNFYFKFLSHVELETVTATGIANDKTAVVRASGWKIHRLDPQIEDMVCDIHTCLDTLKTEESVLISVLISEVS